MGELTWDTPPTEEELGGSQTWDTPPTETELMTVQPAYVEETPVVNEVDEFASTIDMQPSGTVPSEEASNYTMSQPEMQEQQTRQFDEAEESDISNTLAEIQQAITTSGDQLGLTDDSEKSMAKYTKHAIRVLEDKGYKVNKKTEDGVANYTVVGQTGKEYPMEPGMLDSIIASKRELIGSIGAGIISGAGTGALGGAIAGPVGSGVGALGGGAIGGAIGAIVGDSMDVDANSEKYNIPISEEERKDRYLEVGVGDMAGGLVGGAISKPVGKVVSKGVDLIGDIPLLGTPVKALQGIGTTVGDALSTGDSSVFKSINSMPSKHRMAIKTMQEATDMTDKQIDDVITKAQTKMEGELTNDQVVTTLAKESRKENLGLIMDAVSDSPKAKANLIGEIDTRSKQMGDVFRQTITDEGDDELYKLFIKNTEPYSDKFGTDMARQSTNWEKLYKDMQVAGVDEAEPLMQEVAKLSKTHSNYDATLFSNIVTPDKDMGDTGIEKILGVNQRASAGGIRGTLNALGMEKANKVIDALFPSDKGRTTKIITNSLENGKINPAKLEASLVEEGVDTSKARLTRERVERQQVVDATKEAKVVERQAEVERVARAKEVKVAERQARVDEVAKAKADKAEQIATDRLAEVNRKQRSKEILTKYEDDLIAWDKDNLDYVKKSKSTAEYNLLKKRAKASIGTDGEEQAMKNLDDFRVESKFNSDVDVSAKAQAEDDANILKQPKTQIAKVSESPADIRSRGSKDNIPIGGDEDVQKANTEKAIFGNKRRSQAQRKEMGAYEQEVARKEAELDEIKHNASRVKQANMAKDAGLGKEYDSYITNPDAHDNFFEKLYADKGGLDKLKKYKSHLESVGESVPRRLDRLIGKPIGGKVSLAQQLKEVKVDDVTANFIDTFRKPSGKSDTARAIKMKLTDGSLTMKQVKDFYKGRKVPKDVMESPKWKE